MARVKETGQVLLVDDEDVIREALQELLSACGYTVHTANSVDNAIKVLEKKPEIEAVVSDMKMPGKQGVEILPWLNENKRLIPVLFLTGFGTLETCQDAVRGGAFDYILKPIEDKEKLLIPLKHALEKVRLERQNEELKLDILRMAEEHEKLLESILNDAQTKDRVADKISAIVQKWDSR
ncbi:MAG: response regulator [Candidatus Omnitrophica bacterium]|nr:response regulator [Candidatus Omnitrophota bacterium]